MINTTMKKIYIIPKTIVVKCDISDGILAGSGPQENLGSTTPEASGELTGAKKYNPWESWDEEE